MATSIQTGAVAIKALYTRTLESKSVDFVCLSSDYEKVVGDWFDTDFSTKLYDGVRVTREMVPDTAENRECATTKPAASQTRFMTQVTSNTDLIIADTFVAMVNFNPERPEVTVFDDVEAIKTFKALFELAWRQTQ